MIMFDKPSDWTLEDWWYSDARDILYYMPQEIDVLEWICESNMTDAEKNEYPTYKTTGGYLKLSKSSADRQKWWNELPDYKKKTVMSLPNFDADIFKECTGIDVKEEAND